MLARRVLIMPVANSEKSKILGTMWREMPQREKDKYYTDVYKKFLAAERKKSGPKSPYYVFLDRERLENVLTPSEQQT